MYVSLLLLVGSATLLAQNEQTTPPEHPPVQDTATSPAPDPYIPLTVGQSYAWSLHQIFDPGRLFMASARAAIDHSDNNPSGWGQGAEGYAVRVASRLGVAAVRENVAFAVRALDREDPRYFHSPSGSVWRRARYAVGRTFITRNESGGSMPAYSMLVSSFATPFIAGTWRPEPVRAGREFRTGAVGIGIEAGSNICREFWPDIRKRLGR